MRFFGAKKKKKKKKKNGRAKKFVLRNKDQARGTGTQKIQGVLC